MNIYPARFSVRFPPRLIRRLRIGNTNTSASSANYYSDEWSMIINGNG
ncbi:hypothetical protein [Anabaena sp. CCY 9613]